MGIFLTIVITMWVTMFISNYFIPPSPLRYPVQILLFFAMVNLINHYNRKRKRGLVTPTGLKRCNKETVIPFNEIKNITGGPALLNVFTTNISVEMNLLKQEMVKLARAGLTNWTINNMSINIFPGTPGEPLQVTYSPMGKFALGYSRTLYAFIAVLILVGGDYRFLMIFVLIGLYYFLQNYQQVMVRIHDGGVSIIEKGTEHFIPFEEITAVEKDLLSIKITTKDNQVIRLPEQCQYLFEFLTDSRASTEDGRSCEK